MKKVFCFSLIVIYLALASSPLLVKADDVAVITPYIDYPNITEQELLNNTYTTWLTEYLRCGGTIDTKNTSNDYSVNDLLNDFGTFVTDVVGEFIDLVNPFQSEFEWGNGYPLNQATPTMLQFLGMLPFYAINNEEDNLTPSPDINYEPYLEYINGTGFFFKNWTHTTLYPQYTNISMALYPPSQYSWCTFNESNITNSILQSNNNTSYWLSNTCNITSVYIISQDNKYYFTYSGNCPINFTYFGNQYNSAQYRVVGGSQYVQAGFTNYGNFTYTSSLFNNLVDLFSDLIHRVKNVNIYVDGVLWSLANSTTTNYNIELSTGTVTPQGERVRWMYDKEIYVDIDKILERLEDILYEIQHTQNTPTIIKFDDLEDLIVDVNGSPALAVKVVNNDLSLDDRYYEDFGPIIPLFVPMFTPVINDSDIVNITEVSTSPLPDELMEVCGYIFVGTLFACFIHRLLE